MANQDNDDGRLMRELEPRGVVLDDGMLYRDSDGGVYILYY